MCSDNLCRAFRRSDLIPPRYPRRCRGLPCGRASSAPVRFSAIAWASGREKSPGAATPCHRKLPAFGAVFGFSLGVLRLPHRCQLLERNEFGGIDPGVAGGAVGGLFAFGAGFAQALEREIRQGVGADIVADFFHSLVGGDKLALYRRIDPVVAR